jgi:hypothetical protein
MANTKNRFKVTITEVDSHYVEERLPDGVRFTLPKRRLGSLRWLGLIAVVGAGFGFCFLAAWMLAPIQSGWNHIQQGNAFGWGLIAFGCLPLFGFHHVTLLLVCGRAVITNRTSTSIEIRDNRLTIHERFMGKRWTRQVAIPVSQIQELKVGKAKLETSQIDAQREHELMGSHRSALYIEGTEPKPTVIAAAYPQRLLEDLAHDLRRYLTAVTQVESTTIPILDAISDGDTRQPATLESQPNDSNIEVEPRPGGTIYRVPAAGIRGTKGLFLFAIVWNLFISGFFGMMAFLAFQEGESPPIILMLFLIPFVAVGIGVALMSLNMARRRTAIATAGGQLFVISEGIFGKKTRTWNDCELRDVRVGPSGMAVNDAPVLEIQFHTDSGKFGVLSERANDELRWLAGQLSLELGLIEACTDDTTESVTTVELHSVESS